MIFSITLIILLILVVIVWRIKTRSTYLISYLETGTPKLESYKPSKKTKNRYFHFSDGLIDLFKHPELLRFKETFGSKEYLVEPWKRDKNLYIEEGKTKVVVFEFLKDQQGNVMTIIPCLRLVETVMERENNDPLLEYKETSLGVCWNDGEKKRKIVESDFLLGIVRYESI